MAGRKREHSSFSTPMAWLLGHPGTSAFDACRWCIDSLKSTVPIWKREAWDGGQSWGLDAQHVTDLVDVDGSAYGDGPDDRDGPADRAGSAGVGR